VRPMSVFAAQFLLLAAGPAAAQPAPAPEVGHTLSGIVSDLPPQVEPGEAIQLKVLDESKLPPGGTFSLAGVVVDADPPPAGEAVALTPSADAAARPSPESLEALVAALAAGTHACGSPAESASSAIAKSRSTMQTSRTGDPRQPALMPEPEETTVVKSRSNTKSNRMVDPRSPKSAYDVDLVVKTSR
jgi:hypothetical protein